MTNARRLRAVLPLAALGLQLGLAGCGSDSEPGATPDPSPEASANTAAPTEARPDRFGFGQPASDARVSAWDIDVMPDGTGLPPGRGTVAEGARIYAARCAACHGADGQGGLNDRLVAAPGEGFPSGADPDTWTSRTVGNYWPYATTLFDYIRRSMPQNLPGSLTADEVYAVTAWLLHQNRIVPKDAVMSADTLPAVRMPARGRFLPDDRLEYTEVH